MRLSRLFQIGRINLRAMREAQSVNIRARIISHGLRKVYRVIDEGRRKNAPVFAAICRFGLRVFQLVGAKSAFALASIHQLMQKRPPLAQRLPLAAHELGVPK
jgi:hypothetical protein